MMKNFLHGNPDCKSLPIERSPTYWTPFRQMLQCLHQAGIYLHPEQLAEFLLAHGLPVDLCYVPEHLQQKALQVNQNYQGDMARLETVDEQSCNSADFTIY